MQGVGFRFYTLQQAKLLNIKGWVRNTLDGGVLVLAQGNEAAINTLLDYLWVGPPLSEVKSVNKTEVDFIENYKAFEVK